MKLRSVVLAAVLLCVPLAAQANHEDDRYCREFTREVKIGGKWQEAYGLACREPDGSWRIMDGDNQEAYYDNDDDDYRRRRGCDEVVIRERVYVPTPSFGLNINLGGGHDHYGNYSHYRNHAWSGYPRWRSLSWLQREHGNNWHHRGGNSYSHLVTKSRKH